jgi:cytochrome d ubiquinol oxidase subunit II
MEILWFCVIAFMLGMYVILDGFDLGAGILHLSIARTNDERRGVLAAIGPFWDGNEVWLLAAGGTLYFSFPLLYASSFSGFYLPLTIVLWLLILRGMGIELRHQVDHPMWRTFWDRVFSVGSTLLAIFLGAALGNVVRGVPLGADGYFFEPLWTSFTVQPNAGILDWFTVLMGLVGLSTLAAHGGNFLAMKTAGELQARARTRARAWTWAVIVTSLAAAFATFEIRPGVWTNYAEYPWGLVFPLTGAAGLFGMMYFNRKANDFKAFLSSSAFIGGMLSSTAFGLFPSVLPSSVAGNQGLTVYNTAAQSYGLGIGLIWWTIGIVIALGYFAYLFYSFHGKAKVSQEGY